MRILRQWKRYAFGLTITACFERHGRLAIECRMIAYADESGRRIE